MGFNLPDWYTGAMEDMPKHPRLARRGTTFYLRAKVPVEIADGVGLGVGI